MLVIPSLRAQRGNLHMADTALRDCHGTARLAMTYTSASLGR